MEPKGPAKQRQSLYQQICLKLIRSAITGEVYRFKARLIVRGFQMEKGVDFDDSFFPTPGLAVGRFMLSLAVANDYELLLRSQPEDMTRWLTTNQMGWALTREENEIINEKDEREGMYRVNQWQDN